MNQSCYEAEYHFKRLEVVGRQFAISLLAIHASGTQTTTREMKFQAFRQLSSACPVLRLSPERLCTITLEA